MVLLIRPYTLDPLYRFRYRWVWQRTEQKMLTVNHVRWRLGSLYHEETDRPYPLFLHLREDVGNGCRPGFCFTERIPWPYLESTALTGTFAVIGNNVSANDRKLLHGQGQFQTRELPQKWRSIIVNCPAWSPIAGAVTRPIYLSANLHGDIHSTDFNRSKSHFFINCPTFGCVLSYLCENFVWSIFFHWRCFDLVFLIFSIHQSIISFIHQQSIHQTKVTEMWTEHGKIHTGYGQSVSLPPTPTFDHLINQLITFTPQSKEIISTLWKICIYVRISSMKT